MAERQQGIDRYDWRGGTPTVPIKRYARDVLQEGETIDVKAAKTIIDLVEAAYWSENNPGYVAADWHIERATTRARRAGLSEEEISAAKERAGTIYHQFKNLLGVNNDSPLTLQIMAEREKDLRNTRSRIEREKIEKRKLRQKLERNWGLLNRWSDSQLQILNSNQRVHFDIDPVYANSGAKIAKKFQTRTLTQQEYEKAGRTHKPIREAVIGEDNFFTVLDRAEEMLVLAQSHKPDRTRTLRNQLTAGNSIIRQAAADALDLTGWEPKTLKDQVLYLVAKEEWRNVLRLGPPAFPLLLELVDHRDILLRSKALSILTDYDWIPEDPQQEATLYFYQRRWQELFLLDFAAVLPIVRKALRSDETETRRFASQIVTAMVDYPGTTAILRSLIKDKDIFIRNAAIAALTRQETDPIYLQRLLEGNFRDPDSLTTPIMMAASAVHPEWRKDFKPEELVTLIRGIASLPPVGGKIVRGEQAWDILKPSMTVEEQIKTINDLRRNGKLTKTHVHQLTVQGRLPDEFKYTVIALIIHSPYLNDWNSPFFEAPWGTVAPMVHDGGHTQQTINPLWKKVEGRTDFLQRVSIVYEPNLEKLEKLSPEEKSKLPIDTLVKARSQQEERDRLVLEARAYQRLALALHAFNDTTPKQISPELKKTLANRWTSFQQKMDLLLQEYDMAGAASVKWFNSDARKLEEWPGLRHEAPWEPIQTELIHLEEIRVRHPELLARVDLLLQDATEAIDREIGLLPLK